VGRTAQTNTFRSLLPSSIPGGFSAETLAILNQLTLDAQLPAGAAYKLVQ
jgi:hypothetical protein